MKPIKLTLLNEDGSERWFIIIEEHKGQFFVNDDTKYSLFSGPLAIGDTPGQAFDNFLKVETELIEGL